MQARKERQRWKVKQIEKLYMSKNVKKNSQALYARPSHRDFRAESQRVHRSPLKAVDMHSTQMSPEVGLRILKPGIGHSDHSDHSDHSTMFCLLKSSRVWPLRHLPRGCCQGQTPHPARHILDRESSCELGTKVETVASVAWHFLCSEPKTQENK